jgi:hypothetical protein
MTAKNIHHFILLIQDRLTHFFISRSIYAFPIYFVCIIFGALILSCDSNTVDPIIEHGRRDYIWKEDTLDVDIYYNILYRDMVGNTPDDIWLGNSDPGLWHYDGKKWEEYPFPGVIPSALWLFDDNTLWIGTSQKLILKRENEAWTESFELKYENYDMINIYGMYGKSKNDIYAVGMAVETIIPGEEHIHHPTMLHYNGNDWKFLDVPKLSNGGFHKIVYQEDIDTYFIFAVKIENGVILDKLFTFDGENLTEIMSTPGSIGLSSLENKVYINYDQVVYKYSNNKMVLWKDFTNTEFLSDFEGRNENDFFNNSVNGVGHYNGIDYKTIYPTHYRIYSKIVFEKEVFITAFDRDNWHYIIIHGTLKE